MQIVVRQISGLGNQLFQYAAGRYFAKHYGALMRLAVDSRGSDANGYPRPFLLKHFSITAPYHPLTTTERLMLTPKPNLAMAGSILRQALRAQVATEEVDQRYTFVSDLALNRGVQNVYLVGYWQAYRFAAEVEDELRAEFTLRESPTGANLQTLQQIKNAEHPISLHIRRGDYVLGLDGFIALSLDYYHRAITYFQKRIKNPTFFVFSDDIEFARQSLSDYGQMVFVNHNDSRSAHEDLRLMASCRDHIIANSSFSWWGAWMNSRPDKAVYAPRLWHTQRTHSLSDLLPPSWILADNSDTQPS